MRYCGRTFTDAEIELIRALIGATPPLNRAQLSREACERLDWRRPDGRLKEMSCRVALLRMQTDGLITLPPPRNAKPPPTSLALRSSRRCSHRRAYRPWISLGSRSIRSATNVSLCCGTPTSSVTTISVIN